MAGDLTLKQQRFIDHYLMNGGNATAAARTAGYKDAEVSGFDCKQNPVIHARIEERLLADSLSPAEVLHELTDVAKADWRDFLQIRTNPQTGEIVEAKLVLGDKVKALELIGKYHKLFTDRTEVGGDATLLDALRSFGTGPSGTGGS